MKVLKPGRAQKGWSTKATCTGNGNGGGGCGAQLLVEEADIYRTSSTHHIETDHFATFTCPSCGVETDLSEGKVPSHVWDKMPPKPRPETS